MKEYRRSGGIVRTLGAFTLGAAAGSIVALLFAPASGQATRRRIGLQLRMLQRTATRQLGRKITTARQWVVEHVTNGHGRRVTHQA